MLRTAAAALLLASAAAAGAQVPAAYEPHGLFYGQRATLFDVLPVDSTSIVFFGNSITNGCEWHELLGDARVVNRGISGDIVQGLIDRAGSVVKGQPAKVFVMIGVNDISHDVSADSIARAVGRLVDTIAAASPRTRIYLQSMLPFNNSFGRYKLLAGKEQVQRDGNRLLRGLAGRKGITWIDLTDIFADADGNLRADLTNDGLHLLGPAYLLWRDRLLPYLAE